MLVYLCILHQLGDLELSRHVDSTMTNHGRRGQPSEQQSATGCFENGLEEQITLVAEVVALPTSCCRVQNSRRRTRIRGG